MKTETPPGPTARPHSRRCAPLARPQFEALESRLLMAADLPIVALPPPSVELSQATAGVHMLAPREIVVLDASLQDLAALHDAIAQDAPQAEVLVLDASRDAFDQIGEKLAAGEPVSAIHLVAHGQAGQFVIRGAVIDASELARRTAQLQSWDFADNADILLYGCNVADGPNGQAFVDMLASLTGADVAASSDLTGAIDLGADWDLEVSTGSIETATIAGPRLAKLWRGTLDASATVAATSGSPVSGVATPLAFERNAGQTDGAVEFLARGSGYSVFLDDGDAVIDVRHEDGSGNVVRLSLDSAQTPTASTGGTLLSGTSHYLVGDASDWHRDVERFDSVRFDEVYDGIDVQYYGADRRLEYDFLVDAGIDTDVIGLRIEGAAAVHIADSGELVLTLDATGRTMTFQAPVSYQRGADGSREHVDSRYVLRADGTVGFDLGNYDRTRDLIIDPILGYATYLGGTGLDTIEGIETDASGNVYVTGRTGSAAFPTSVGAYDTALGGSTDAFVTKFDSTGVLQYSTYFGGTGNEWAYNLTVDGSGQVYVVGETSSSDLAIVNGADSSFGGSSDGYFVKLNAAGSAVLYSTYYGGANADYLGAVHLGSGNSVYVAGGTTAATWDGYAGAINTGASGAGSLTWSQTYAAAGTEKLYDMDVDSTGDLWLIGETSTSGLTTGGPYDSTHNGGADVFLVRMSAAGSVEYVTYYGGTGNDYGDAIVVAADNTLYITGTTFSTSGIASTGAYDTTGDGTNGNAFLVHLDPSQSGSAQRLFGTYYGTSGASAAYEIAIDAEGRPVLVGQTAGTIPTTTTARDTTLSGSSDGFVAIFAADGSALRYGSYLGGDGTESANAAAVDASGRLYVVGQTASTTLHTTGAYDTTGDATNGDGFIAQFLPLASAARTATDGGLSINTDGGNDAYLAATNGGAVLGGQTALTLEFDFALNSVGSTDSTLLSYATALVENEVAFRLMPTGRVQLLIENLVWQSGATYAQLLDGERHQVAISWNQADGSVSLHIDGEAAESSSGFKTGATIDGGGLLLFAQDQDALGGAFQATQRFSGTLYDVRVFSDVRTDTEIAGARRATLPDNTEDLVANWRFDDWHTDGTTTEAVAGHTLTLSHASGTGFTPSQPTLNLGITERSETGTVVGAVTALSDDRQTRIDALLAADATLTYNAQTDKFYKLDTSFVTWASALSTATSTTLNTVAGQLVTVRSATENALLSSITGGNAVWLGAADAAVEGTWRWYDGSTPDDEFWQGAASGYRIDGAYTNWDAGEPSDTGGEDRLYQQADGTWNDGPDGMTSWTLIEWNADEVLDASQAITYAIVTQTVTGAFAIDADTGVLTVADGSLLDYDTQPSHSVTVRATEGSLSYDRTYAIALGNLALEADASAPASASTPEDTTRTFSSLAGNAITVSDGTASDTRMQVSLSVSQGVLTLSQTTGLTIVSGANASAAMVLDGTESALNAALDGMTYTPTSNYSGSDSLSVTTSVSADLAALYTFDDGTVTDAAEGAVQDGSLVGNATTTTDATRGTVLSLDGSGDSAQIASVYGSPANVTIGGWVNLRSGGSRAEFISLDDRIHIALDDPGLGVKGSIQTGAATWDDLASGRYLAGDGWHHVMFVVDDTNDVNTLYIDGVAVASEASPLPVYWTGATTTYLGQHPGDFAYLDGLMDDVRVHTRALSAAEVAALAAEAPASDSASVAITVTGVNDAPAFVARDGIVTTAIGTGTEAGNSVILQSDGKILVAGYGLNGGNNDFALVRHNSDGTLDTSFSGDGMLFTGIVTGNDVGQSVAVQADGKILVAGYGRVGGNDDFVVVRYNTDGTLDTSFSGDGIVTTAIGSGADRGNSLVLQTDGKILVAGQSSNGSNDDFALVRYNSDGTLDTSFSGDGILTTAISAGADVGRSVTLQTDGRILVAGSAHNGTNDDFALVRYNSDGTLDTSFSGDGMLTTAFGSNADVGRSVTVQADGKVLMAGSASNGANNDFAIARYNSDGTLDTGFSGDGLHMINIASNHDDAYSVTVQADGKILVAGTATIALGNSDVAVVRLDSNGTLDISFSGDGIATTPIGPTHETGNSVAVQADGKILVAGFVSFSGNQDFALVRYNSDGTLDTRFDNADTLGGTVAFTENGAAVVLDSNVHVFDAELRAADNFNGATLTLVRNGGANAQDVYSATGSLSALTEGANLVLGGTAIGTVTTNSAGTLVLTFDANATQARVNSALQQIAYANSSEAPPASVQIDWTFDDGNTGAQGSGGALSASGSTTVTIAAVNDAPVNTIPGLLAGHTPANGNMGDQAYEVKASQSWGQTFAYDSAGATYTVSDVQLVLYRASDAPAGQTLTVSLRSVWNGSVLASGTVSGDSLSTSEAWVNVPFSSSATLNDNQSYFLRIDSSGLEKIYVGVADTGSYANGDLVDKDGATQSGKDMAFVLDAPLQTAEETALTLSVAGGTALSIADVDAGSGSLQVSLTVANGTVTLAQTTGLSFSTGDGTADTTLVFSGTLAALNGSLDGMSFLPSANFNGVASIVLTTSDLGNTGSGGALVDSDTQSILVTAADDAPVFSGLDGTPTYVEGGAAVVLDANVSVSDTELSAANDFSGATLTLARNGGADADDALAFDGLNVTTVAENVFVGGIEIGDYVFTGGELVVTFGANATQARVNTLLQNIVYWNWSDAPPASVQIDWTFSDGNGGAQGSGGALSATGSTTVTISAVNDTPTPNAGGPYTLAEGAALVLDASASSDADGDTLTYAWDLDNDGNYGESGEPTTVGPSVSWATLQSFGIDDHGSYTIGLRVGDGTVTTTTTTTLTVTNVAPTITVSGAASVAAGQTYTLTVGVTDPGDDAVTSWKVNWGDGTVSTYVGTPTSVAHTFAQGGFSRGITVSVTDEDGSYSPNDVLLSSYLGDRVLRLDGTSGALEATLPTTVTLDGPSALAIGPDGYLYVTSLENDRIIRYDLSTNTLVGTFVTAGSGGLDAPAALSFGPDGNLYVASYGTNQILEYNGTTGAFIGAFASLDSANALAWGPDGYLYAGSWFTGEVRRFDIAGAAVDAGAFLTLGGGFGVSSLLFGPDGFLYVGDANFSDLLKYNATTGALVGTIDSAIAPYGLASGPDGTLFVADFNNQAVERFRLDTGASLGSFDDGATGVDRPWGVTFSPSVLVAVTAGTPGVTVSAISGSTSEAGTTATFSIVLDSAPLAPVTIALSSGDATEGSLSTSSVTFTVSNWNTAQTVTVAGVDDALGDGDVTYSVVTGAASSADSNYNGLTVADVSVTNVDSDGAPVLVIPAPVATPEDTTISLAGLSVSDASGDLSILQLAVSNGSLTVSLPSGSSIASGMNGSSAFTLTGNQGSLVAALATLRYRPSLGVSGADSLSIIATDTTGLSASGALALSITAVNDAPIARDDSATAVGLSGVSGNVLTNDSDAEADPLQVTQFSIAGDPTIHAAGASVTIALTGTVSLAANGDFSFTPQVGFSGAAPLVTYTVADGNGGTATGGLALRAGSSATGWGVSGSTSVTEGQNASYVISLSDSIAFGGSASVALSLVDATTSGSDHASFAAAVTTAIASRPDLSFDGTRLAYSPTAFGGYGRTYSATGAAGAVSIAGTGTSLELRDDEFVRVDLDFAFDFFGVSQSSVIVDANGYVTFGSSVGSWFTNGSLAAGTALGGLPAIAAFWDDLDPDASGAVYVETLGSPGSRQFVIEWSDTPYYGSASADGATIQLVLHEGSGIVEMRYLDVDFAGFDTTSDGGASATIGLQNGSGTGDEFSFDTASVVAGSSLVYRPQGVAMSPLTITLATTDDSTTEGTEDFAIHLSAALGSGITSADTVTTLLTDNDSIAPVNVVPVAVTAVEDTVFAFAGGNAISITDGDVNVTSVSVSVTSGTVNLTVASGASVSAGLLGSSAFTLSGSLAQLNTSLSTLAYTPDADFAGGDTLVISSADASALSDTDTVTLTVSPVDDAPVLTGVTLSVSQGGSVTLSPADFAVSDPDGQGGARFVDVRNVSDGSFEVASAPGTPISTFAFADVVGGLVRFVHSGSSSPPAFEASVRDSVTPGSYVAASVGFTPTPVLIVPGPTPEQVYSVILNNPDTPPSPSPATPPTPTPSSQPASTGTATQRQSEEESSRAQGSRGLGEVDPRLLMTMATPRTPPVPAAPAAEPGAAAVTVAGAAQGSPTASSGVSNLAPLPTGIAPGPAQVDAAQAVSPSTDRAGWEMSAPLSMGLPPATTDQTRKPSQEEQEFEIMVNGVRLTGVSLSVGVVTWALRAGGIISSLLASLPAWRYVDPLPILERAERSRVVWRRDEEESTEAPEDSGAEASERAVTEMLEGRS